MLDDSIKEKKGIVPVLIEKEMQNCYLDYAMSVIVGRALPDVRDGLKPVHRRSLFAMHALGNIHSKPYLKSARVVGDVIGKYHPHGDSAVYNTIVRMAQEFSLRYPLIDGQGNFGSIDGDSPAAMRYTEIRMKKFSEEILKDLDKDTVDWRSNYDDSLKEPSVLPTRIPNLLVNGSSGIAVGMATKIPPHNLSEVMKALILLLENSDVSIDDLIKIIKGPDFPTAGSIYGSEGIYQAYHTGKGTVQIRSKVDVEIYGTQDKERIVVTELPYQINKAKLIETIAHLVNNKELTGIQDIRDESSREGIRIAIDLKKGENSQIIINQLFKMTSLQTSFAMIFLSIFKNRPKVMNIKEQLICFIDHRREIVMRRTYYELKKAKIKAHLLEGLKVAIENIDAIIQCIKKSSQPSVARSELTEKYSLSLKQAQAILDMKLQRITGLERDKIIKDYREIIDKIKRLNAILDSENLVEKIIKEEFEYILEEYGDERKTEIIEDIENIQNENLIKREDVIVQVTHNGYIKRMELNTYKTQGRGGRGVKGSFNMSNDIYTDIFIGNTHSTLLFFTSRGLVFSKKVYNIPDGARTSKGKNLINFLQLSDSEKIKEIICLPENEILKNKFLFFSTEKGVVKKTELIHYKKINQNGLRAIKMIEGDNICNVRISNGCKDVLLCSTSGKIIRFSENDCRPQGRVSQGVRGIFLKPNERIIGMEIIDDNVEILSITEYGFGKRTISSQYRRQTRGGKGVLAMKLTRKNGEIACIKPVVKTDDLMIMTDKGQVIRVKVSSVSLLSRSTQGVKIIKLKEQEKVVAIENIRENY